MPSCSAIASRRAHAREPHELLDDDAAFARADVRTLTVARGTRQQLQQLARGAVTAWRRLAP